VGQAAGWHVSVASLTIEEIGLERIWLRKDVLAASFALNVLGLALPIMILQIYDRVIGNQSYATLGFIVLMLIGAFALEFALRILRAATLAAAGARYEHRANLTAFDKILSADLQSFETDTANTHWERLSAIRKVKTFYAQSALVLIADLPFVAVFLILIAFIAGWLILIPMAFLGAFVLAVRLLSDAMSTVLRNREASDERRFNFLIETLRGVHTVKSLGLETPLIRRHARLQGRSSEVAERYAFLANVTQAMASLVAQAATICVVAVGAVVVVKGGLTMGGLAATTMLTGRTLQPVIRGLMTWTRYQSISLYEEQVRKLRALPAERIDPAPAAGRIAGRIRFDDVTFRYDGAAAPTLRHVTLDIAPNETIGVVGGSGSGKTTLLQLMNGVLTPTQGRVLIDDLDLSEVDAAAMRGHIAYLPTTAAMFPGTILENVAMFRQGQFRRRAVASLRALGLHDYIATLPKGLDTEIGGAHVKTHPAGFVQACAIAGGLVDDRRIILFDYAHKSVDHIHDRRLLEVIGAIKGRATMVLVTERPSYLRLCDRVFEVDGGEVRPRPAVRASTNAAPASSAPIAAGAA